jgi:hypothetical protein
MSVESSAVQIVINVTDANSGAVIAGVEHNIQKLGAAGVTTGKQMRELGDAGASAGRKIKQGMDEAGIAAMSAKEKMHLLTEEVGIHIPSVVTLKPAIRGHFKTGQRDWPET